MKNEATSRLRAPRRVGGFTLIEIMIVVALIALLTSIALPIYTSQVARARRADARTQLLQAAQYMQRFYSANDQYLKDRSGNNVGDQLPANLKRSPVDGAAQYELVVNPTLTTYTLTMAPVAGSKMATDECGSYIINSIGQKSVTSGKMDLCWK